MTPDITAKESSPHATAVSKGSLWTGRILGALSTLFLLMDGVMKLIKPAPVVEATVRLGYPESVIQSLGIVLLVCTILRNPRRIASATAWVRLVTFILTKIALLCDLTVPSLI